MRFGSTTIWMLLGLVAVGVRGQELEPRTYAQTPTGVNFIAAGYGFSGASR